VTTPTPMLTLPEAPEVSAVLPLNSTAIQVMWIRVNDTSSYVLEVRLLDGTLVQQVEVSGASVTIISELAPYTSYYIQVASVGIGGNIGPFSEHHNVSTPEAGTRKHAGYPHHYSYVPNIQVSVLTCITAFFPPLSISLQLQAPRPMLG